MGEEKIKKEIKIVNKCGKGGAGGAVYGLGLIGALVYYIQHSATFMDGVIGFLKALVWPALLVYRVLDLLKF
jgi:hypothetical protein